MHQYCISVRFALHIHPILLMAANQGGGWRGERESASRREADRVPG